MVLEEPVGFVGWAPLAWWRAHFDHFVHALWQYVHVNYCNCLVSLQCLTKPYSTSWLCNEWLGIAKITDSITNNLKTLFQRRNKYECK